MIIDLHGMTEQEAIGVVASAIISLEFDEVDEIEIITGNGYVLKRMTIEEIESRHLKWYHPNNNLGSIIVKK